jgi:formate/nitrite transporter FocA (FNT family)
MTDRLIDKEPTLSGPLKLMAVAAAAILGFGLCSVAMTKFQSFSTAGAIVFLVAVPLFAAGLLWLVINVIHRAIRRSRRQSS